MASIIQYDHDSSLSASAASSAVKTYADSRHTSKSLKVLKSAPADSTNIARVYIVPGSASRIDIDSDTAGETRGSRPNSHGKGHFLSVNEGCFRSSEFCVYAQRNSDNTFTSVSKSLV